MSEKNSMVNFDLPKNDTYHTVKQFSVEYLAVSMQNDVAIFNVMAKCKVQNLKMTGMFQRAITVHPNGIKHMGEDKFVQECLIGYKYGTFSKLGLICERTKPELYTVEESKGNAGSGEEPMEVDEDSSLQAAAAGQAEVVVSTKQRDLTAFNLAEFERKLMLQNERPMAKQKVH